jgi:hypothetical protein
VSRQDPDLVLDQRQNERLILIQKTLPYQQNGFPVPGWSSTLYLQPRQIVFASRHQVLQLAHTPAQHSPRAQQERDHMKIHHKLINVSDYLFLVQKSGVLDP